jgi:hypothetical protein
MGFYKLCRCKFKGKTHKGQKIPTQAFFLRFHLLNSRLFGEGGSFVGKTGNNFYQQKGLNNYNTT